MNAATPTGAVEAVLGAHRPEFNRALGLIFPVACGDCGVPVPGWAAWDAHLAAALRDAPQPEEPLRRNGLGGWAYACPVHGLVATGPTKEVVDTAGGFHRSCAAPQPEGHWTDAPHTHAGTDCGGGEGCPAAPQPSGSALTEDDILTLTAALSGERMSAFAGEAQQIIRHLDASPTFHRWLAARTQPSARRDPQPSEAAWLVGHLPQIHAGFIFCCDEQWIIHATDLSAEQAWAEHALAAQPSVPDPYPIKCGLDLCPGHPAQPSAPVQTAVEAWEQLARALCRQDGKVYWTTHIPAICYDHADAALAQDREEGS